MRLFGGEQRGVIDNEFDGGNFSGGLLLIRREGEAVALLANSPR